MGNSLKKILITGCSGFIGRHAIEYGLKHGYEIVGLDVNPISKDDKDFSFFKGSINDKKLVEDAAKGCEYILHLGALASLPDFNKDLYSNYTTNIVGFMNVIDAAKTNTSKFVYASSSGVYQNEFGEDTVIDVHKQRNHYGKSKLIDEMIADSYIDTHNMKAVGLRYFNVYGPGEEDKYRSSPITQFLLEMKKKDTITIFGDGKQSKDFTYIDDVIKLTFALLEDKESVGVYNIGTGVTTSFNEIAKMMNPGRIVYTENPYLSTYMFYLKADTRKLLKKFKDFKFTDVKEGIERTKAAIFT